VSLELTRQPRTTELTGKNGRRVDVQLYGGDTAKGAPLAAWYRRIGITDVWLAYPKGAFPQDAGPESQGLHSLDELNADGTLRAYRQNGVRYWWFERPVPDFFYERSKRPDFPKSHLWDSSAETDEDWTEVCNRIKSIYPHVRNAGFRGIVYDSESYYSYNTNTPWLWGGHGDQYGLDGNYYKRGLQVGQAITAGWPKVKVIIAYCHGYAGERWWYQGLKDGGVDFYLGPEHTYGAGPADDRLGDAWFQSWWGGRKRIDALRAKGTSFTKIAEHLNQEGFHPPKRTNRFNSSMVGRLLSGRGLHGPRPSAMADPGLLEEHESWLTDLARQLKIPVATLHRWRRVGWLHSRKVDVAGGRWAIWADEDEWARLRRLRSHRRQWPTPYYPADLTTPKLRGEME